MPTTEETITEIENWFRECSGDNIRPKLLCKLAFIEFFGWIEEWMDDAVRELNGKSINDSKWVEKNVIKPNNGFDYIKHFRPMVCSIIGEHKMRKAESEFEETSKFELEKLKSDLGSYWKKRCEFAHQEMPAHQAAQIRFDAPSWTKNQYRIMKKTLDALKKQIILQA